jgi:hypothetical protein
MTSSAPVAWPNPAPSSRREARPPSGGPSPRRSSAPDHPTAAWRLPLGRPHPEVGLLLPGRDPLSRNSLQQLRLDIIMRRPRCARYRRTRRSEYTIPTGRAPGTAVTVRT